MKTALVFLITASAWCAELPAGKLIERVECEATATQTYALYVPSNYTPARDWSVIFLFDPGGRGERGVERYQAAAEKYGYIVAGSNNSRNGPWDVSLFAAKVMTEDVRKRFHINAKRMYTAGMSGGARVAMKLALDSGTMAGVLASSAGFPDEFHSSVGFPIFGTAGTDDFNHREMSELDAHLTSAHRVEYFDGPHTWLPAALAMDGVEWMELQSMKAGTRVRDPKLIDAMLAGRMARVEGMGKAESVLELRSIVKDFDGLTDVGKINERAASAEQRADTKEALKSELAAQQRELRLTSEVYQLRDRATNQGSFARLKETLLKLNDQSKATEDSGDRRIARRILGGFLASSRGSGGNEMQQLLNQLRPSEATGGAR